MREEKRRWEVFKCLKNAGGCVRGNCVKRVSHMQIKEEKKGGIADSVAH